jgi:hypothetical protein
VVEAHIEDRLFRPRTFEHLATGRPCDGLSHPCSVRCINRLVPSLTDRYISA